jgi:hypothetical protein
MENVLIAKILEVINGMQMANLLGVGRWNISDPK